MIHPGGVDNGGVTDRWPMFLLVMVVLGVVVSKEQQGKPVFFPKHNAVVISKSAGAV